MQRYMLGFWARYKLKKSYTRTYTYSIRSNSDRLGFFEKIFIICRTVLIFYNPPILQTCFNVYELLHNKSPLQAGSVAIELLEGWGSSPGGLLK